MTAKAPPTARLPTAAEIVRRLAAVRQTVPSLREVRRQVSRELKPADGPAVIALGIELVPLVPRFITSELVAGHPAAFAALNRKSIEQLGAGISSWYDTDGFGITLSGPAWRAGLLPDVAVTEWAHSPDLWWRRTAL